jgi:NitT/TauT family transport system substrate-binding protein
MSKGLNTREEDIRAAYVQALDPDARPKLDVLRRDIAFFKKSGSLSGEPDLGKLVDVSFVDAAVKELGPYKPSAK